MSEFVFTFGSDATPVDPGAEPVNQRIDDHVARAKVRLAYRFQKPRILGFVEALVKPIQNFENVAWQVFAERNVDNAVGVQLDQIGEKVGQPRLGYLDDAYRRLIRARISANKSNGTVNDLIRISNLVIDDPAASIVVTQFFPASVRVFVDGLALDEDTADILIGFLRKAVAAGVRVTLEYLTAAPSASFGFAGLGGPGFASVLAPSPGGKFASVKE